MAYKTELEFEWDEAKSHACFVRRGFDFAAATQVFFDPLRIVTPDCRHDYGEDRFQVIGAIGERIFVIVYTMRGMATRIISARKANARETGHYEHNARHS